MEHRDELISAAGVTLQSVVTPLFADPFHTYSLGVQGALAEFMCQSDESGEGPRQRN